MENELKEYEVQVGPITISKGGYSTIKFLCSLKTLIDLAPLANQEGLLLKFIIKGAEDEPMLGFIHTVHISCSGGEMPKYFTIKLDSSQKIQTGQLVALSEEMITLKIEIVPKDKPKDEEMEETPAM